MQIVFHLVTSTNGIVDENIFNGITNIMDYCVMYNIDTLYMPLYLTLLNNGEESTMKDIDDNDSICNGISSTLQTIKNFWIKNGTSDLNSIQFILPPSSKQISTTVLKKSQNCLKTVFKYDEIVT